MGERSEPWPAVVERPCRSCGAMKPDHSWCSCSAAQEAYRQHQEWLRLSLTDPTGVVVGRMHGKTQAIRDAEDLGRWLREQT